MIYYLKGKIAIKGEDFLVIDVGGVGYKVFSVPKEKDSVGREITMFCFMQNTDRDVRLYGFKEKENLDFFEKLINMSGIGPKTALRIASIAPMGELKRGIEKGDKEIMRKIFSIGEKKGQQVVFELSRKIVKEPGKDEAFEALRGLGFCDSDIKKVLEEVPAEKTKEEKVTEALKILGENDKG